MSKTITEKQFAKMCGDTWENFTNNIFSGIIYVRSVAYIIIHTRIGILIIHKS
jgi:hypothetical protein